MLLVGSVAAAARRPRENLRRRSNLYIHCRDEEVKNDYREAKDVQSTVGGGIGKGESECQPPAHSIQAHTKAYIGKGMRHITGRQHKHIP